MNYEKLKKDLLNKAGISGSKSLVVTVDNANEIELLRLAKEHNLDISAY
ncbi:MAG TPA: hypothetical protein VIM42_10935 [Clostridium sp.]